MGKVSDVLGATPPRQARPVSLAVRNVLLNRRAEASGDYGILIGVSGGADSLSLAIAAVDIAERHKIPYLAVVVDHGMRADSAEEAEGVAEYLRQLGIREVKVRRPGGGAPSSKVSPETSARTLRHNLLEVEARSWGRKLGQVDILLGHTMDDQAETVLLRLARGSGTHSLAAMEKVLTVGSPGEVPRVARVRPLLSVRRSDTEAFCLALELRVVEDPTNCLDGPWRTQAGAPLPRTAIRWNVLPALTEALGQDPVPALAKTAVLAARDDAALSDWAGLVMKNHLYVGPEQVRLPLEALSEVPSAVATRVLVAAAARAGVPPLNRYQINSLEELVKNDKNAAGARRVVDLPGNYFASRDQDILQITKKEVSENNH